MGTVCRNFITATATLFIILTAAHLQEVKSFGIFELNLVSFWNGAGRDDFLGGCCGGEVEGGGGDCPPCPVYLRVCVKHYQAIVDTNSPCTFHEFVTPLLVTRPNDTRTQVLQHPHTMTFDLNFTWLGEFSLIVEAWHPSERTGSHKVLVSRFIGQRILKVGPEWSSDELTTDRSTLHLLYRVVCSAHYYGPSCGQLCRPRDDTFGHYTCGDRGQKICKQGWTGSYCDKALCLPGCHHGTCELPNECNCRPGWVGRFCSTCTRYPGCMHGTCDRPWQCNCDEGWGGLFCDHDLNYCTNHKPCQNGGTCTNTGQGSYTCNCTQDFMGADCDVPKNPCRQNPCRNEGVCQNSLPGEYSCSCLPGFYGRHCDTTASICTTNPCQNGGSCLHDDHSGVICRCPQGFKGIWCADKDPLLACNCANGGTCVQLPTGLHCRCPAGLSGERCEEGATTCACQNGGSCRPDSSCSCPPGFSGPHCEVRSCSEDTCAEGGSCRDTPRGPRCDCGPTTCLNGAFCRDTESGFQCQCPGGFHGLRCQHPNRQSSNVSHRVSSPREALSGRQVALIASLSSLLPLLVLLMCCLVGCTLRRRRRMREAAPKSTKELDLEAEEENDRNAALHMNNQCHQKIVNALDRPAHPPKVLNVDQKVLDNSWMGPHTKKDNASVSGHPPDWPSSNSAGIYVIEDHFRSPPQVENVLATEV